MGNGADGIRTHDLLRARQVPDADTRWWAPINEGFGGLNADQRQPALVGVVTACVTALLDGKAGCLSPISINAFEFITGIRRVFRVRRSPALAGQQRRAALPA